MSPRSEGGSKKRAEKDIMLRIKERINNGPAEARRKESNKNNMKNKEHKRKKCIHCTMQLSSLILQQCSSPPPTQSTMKGVTLK